MVELVKFILSHLVDHPDKLSIKEIEGETAIVYEITAEKSDLGKIIGKQGKIINSVREVVRAAASKDNNKKIQIEVI
ncbi:MAG: RNA-binding protein [Candidatus Cloacimonadota bacterium]|nr:MAG: RNA-binding protein [Candidatus Cloacimonadota bacterium]